MSSLRKQLNKEWVETTSKSARARLRMDVKLGDHDYAPKLEALLTMWHNDSNSRDARLMPSQIPRPINAAPA